MTVLYVVLTLPRAISRPYILFRWTKSTRADHRKLRVKFIGFLPVSLDLSVDSMFIDFFLTCLPDIVYGGGDARKNARRIIVLTMSEG